MVALTPDCDSCAALCCVALAFDKGDMFAFDKPAGEACRHLQGPRCGIHAGLEGAGQMGCVHYQCEGAGQRVVQEVFNGESWQQRPELLAPMLVAFARMRAVHRQLVLLEATKALPLSETQKQAVARFQDRLTPKDRLTTEMLAALENSGVFQALPAFYQSLRAIATAASEGST